jgi:hypothetical protein
MDPHAEDTFAAALREGRYRDAGAHVAASIRAGDDRCRAMVLTARLALERHDWPLAIGLTPVGCPGDEEGFLWYARGLAAAKAIGRSEYMAAAPVAREAAAQLDVLAQAVGRRGAAEVRRLSVLAAIVASQDEREELLVLLAHAVDLARALDSGIEQDAPAAIDELAGDSWLLVDRYKAARESYEQAIHRNPRRGRAVLGLARSCVRLEDTACAEAAYRRFLSLWQAADEGLPETAEARQFLARTAGRETRPGI